MAVGAINADGYDDVVTGCANCDGPSGDDRVGAIFLFTGQADGVASAGIGYPPMSFQTVGFEYGESVE